jgi:membrane-associated phospholipid phosphatase
LGNFQRVTGAAGEIAKENRVRTELLKGTRPRATEAASVSAALSLLWLVVYGGCAWITAHRTDVGTWYYGWERWIPFVPVMIVPYMSIDLFFLAAPFLCRSREELSVFAKRIALAIVVAGGFFLARPLRMDITVPQTQGWMGVLFKLLHDFDQPTNLFPSLHIALRTILAHLYVRHSKGLVRWFNRIWFSLIGFSTLLTYQHHFPDIVGGFILAGICFYTFRENQPRWPVRPNWRVSGYYAVGALTAATLAPAKWPWTAVLLWPAVALGIVALGYAGWGPAIYRKSNGRLPFTARLLLAPSLMGQYLSLAHYRRGCNAWDELTPRVWIGAKLGNREAVEARRRGVTAMLDLTAEFSEAPAFLEATYLNIPMLDLTGPSLAQTREAVDFITQRAGDGVVYIHCKAGYSRTAAVAGAYLLAAGLAETPESAIERLREARPSIVIRSEARAALAEFSRFLNTEPKYAGL